MEERGRIDSWFIGFALVENQKIAWAVVVDGGGYGARAFAPIAGNLLAKAESCRIIERRTSSAEAHARARMRGHDGELRTSDMRDSREILGIGRATKIDRVEIKWPSDKATRWTSSRIPQSISTSKLSKLKGSASA